MTSGVFHSIELSSITVSPDRQRRDLGDIASLANSMQRLGLVHPIVITRDRILVAGERRLTAASTLKWTHISAQYTDELDRLTLELIENEENVKRKNLTWQEEHDALIRIITIRKELDNDVTKEEIALSIDRGVRAVEQHLLVEEHRENPLVKKEFETKKGESSFKTVRNTVTRIKERLAHDETRGLTEPGSQGPQSRIQTADFNLWAPDYSGPTFNLIHCDFPYGINAHLSAGQNSAMPVDYDDTADIYWSLFKTLSVHLDRFCAPSAHMIFWFSPAVYCATWEMLKLIDDFRFDEHPLIWQRGENEGIAPDPARRPRRVYEMAFFGWRGDRKIIRTKANSIVAPTERDRHPHEKSEIALRHFFEMCVDEHTSIFDPTCGSGSALRAAKSLGARRYLGLEISEEYASVARRTL